jgi:hypothetical protein
MKFSDLRLSTDRIVSLSAMIVGVGSLFIITYQTRPDRNIPALYVDKIMSGRLIPAGETVLMLEDLLRLFEIAGVPKSWLAGAGIPLTGTDRAVVEITYSSVYGDRWRVRSDRLVPEPF